MGWGSLERFGVTIEAQRRRSNCSRERFRVSRKGQVNHCPRIAPIMGRSNFRVSIGRWSNRESEAQWTFNLLFGDSLLERVPATRLEGLFRAAFIDKQNIAGRSDLTDGGEQQALE
jgi:hypothetical protein